ncbi:Uncharacterized relative of glutathione S-transferase [Candidatus Terasakiella magnetica]|nr:Uncharacterized relative of glutathione S-transferase [Candidatus Terasakiella magnetica]
MIAPKTIALYAVVLAAFYVYLSIRVIKARMAANAALGDAGNPLLQRAIRAHGNFAEFVPFAVLLIALAEMNGSPVWSIHVLGTVLVLARLCHAFGISREPENLQFRKIGMVGTFVVLIGAGLHAVIGAGL